MSKTIQRTRAYSPDGTIGKVLAEAFALQAEIQRLQAELDVHRERLLTHMEGQKLDKLELGSFVVSRRIRHNWSYTPETHNEMLKLQTTQAWEQRQGLASDRPRAYIALTFREAS